MKRFLSILICILALGLSAHAQILSESSPYRWQKIKVVRQGFAGVRCCIFNEGTEQETRVYYLWATTTNQFDNFSIKLGEIDDAIKTLEYFVKFSDEKKDGDKQILSMAGGKDLTIMAYKFLGSKGVLFRPSDCAAAQSITRTDLLKLIKVLNEIKLKGGK